MLRLLGTPRQHLGALLHSTAVVAFLTSAGGTAYLSGYLRTPTHGYATTAIDGQVSAAGAMIVMLTKRDGTNNVRQQLCWKTAIEDRVATMDVPGIRPTCFAAYPGVRKLFLANETDGGIYLATIQEAPASPDQLGRHVQGFPHRLVLSPDGHTLLSLGSSEIYAWDLDSWQLRWRRLVVNPTAAAILPNGRTIICGGRDHATQVEEIDPGSGGTLYVMKENGRVLQHISADPDSRYVVAIDVCGGVLRFEWKPNGESWDCHRVAEDLVGAQAVVPAFSPESDLIVLGDDDGRRLVIRDLASDVTLCTIQDSPDTPWVGSAFLESDTLVSWKRDASIRVWKLERTQKSDQGAISVIAVVQSFRERT